MKIRDLKEMKLPIKGKLSNGFNLDESLDVGMIIQINSISLDSNEIFGDSGRSFKIEVCTLPEDNEYNHSVAEPTWYDTEGKPCLTYFDVNTPNEFGQYKETLYVMENDDWFDLIEEDTIEKKIDLLIEDYERRLKTVKEILEEMRVDGVSTTDEIIRVATKGSTFRTFISELIKLKNPS